MQSCVLRLCSVVHIGPDRKRRKHQLNQPGVHISCPSSWYRGGFSDALFANKTVLMLGNRLVARLQLCVCSDNWNSAYRENETSKSRVLCVDYWFPEAATADVSTPAAGAALVFEASNKTNEASTASSTPLRKYLASWRSYVGDSWALFHFPCWCCLSIFDSISEKTHPLTAFKNMLMSTIKLQMRVCSFLKFCLLPENHMWLWHW